MEASNKIFVQCIAKEAKEQICKLFGMDAASVPSQNNIFVAGFTEMQHVDRDSKRAEVWAGENMVKPEDLRRIADSVQRTNEINASDYATVCLALAESIERLSEGKQD